MHIDNNNPIIAEPTTIIIPAKWEKPELFKTDFENTESGTKGWIKEGFYSFVAS